MAGELAYDPSNDQLVYSPATGQLALNCDEGEPSCGDCCDCVEWTVTVTVVTSGGGFNGSPWPKTCVIDTTVAPPSAHDPDGSGTDPDCEFEPDDSCDCDLFAGPWIKDDSHPAAYECQLWWGICDIVDGDGTILAQSEGYVVYQTDDDCEGYGEAVYVEPGGKFCTLRWTWTCTDWGP